MIAAAGSAVPLGGHAATVVGTTTITGRNLWRLVRVLTLLVFATVQPVLFVLLFTYAFGDAIHPPGAVTGLLAAAAILTLAHSAMTGRAAPVMFQIGRAGDDEAALTPLLTRFTTWSVACAAAQTAALIVVAAAVVAGS